MKKRHQGAFNPAHPAPWEISRGWIEKAMTCEACFWLKKAANLKEIGIPSFNINTNTDILLKRDHDQYRGKGPSPIMVSAGLEHLRPFAHPDLELWTDSKQFGLSPNHFNTIHEETHILFGGGLDDVFENIETGELHIVDYKSTSQDGGNKTEPAPLDESFLMPPGDPKKKDYKAGYRRQAEMYQWILRRKGFQVSNTAYFLYVDGISRGLDGMLTDDDPHTAWMRFEAQIIPYVGDDSWVEAALHKAKELAQLDECPDHAEDCDTGRWFNAAIRAERAFKEPLNKPTKQDPLASGRKRKEIREQAAMESFREFSDWKDGNN